MKILNYKSIGKGLMVASFDVEIPEVSMTIRGCTLFDKDGNKWVGFPSRKFDGKDGKPAYFSFVVMEKEAKARFDAACMKLLDVEAYKEMSGGNKAPVGHANEEAPPW